LDATCNLTALMHRGEAGLPWIEFDPGIKTQFPHIDEDAGIFFIHSRAQPGFLGRLHRHRGHVFALTVSGAWKYLEHEEVNRAGSYLFEQDGSCHTFKCLDDNEGETDFWVIVQGALEYLDEGGDVVAVLDAATARQRYVQACLEQGFGRPDVIGIA
jgi:hypothetical protein